MCPSKHYDPRHISHKWRYYHKYYFREVQICNLVNDPCMYNTSLGRLKGIPCMFTFRKASKPWIINITSQTWHYRLDKRYHEPEHFYLYQKQVLTMTNTILLTKYTHIYDLTCFHVNIQVKYPLFTFFPYSTRWFILQVGQLFSGTFDFSCFLRRPRHAKCHSYFFLTFISF